MYCFPSTGNDPGPPAAPEPVGNSHRTLPVLASNARNMRSLVPPANSNPPPVASTGPQLNDGRLVVQTFLPVSRFQACRSEEHTSELQSRPHLVCRLLLAKK